VDLVIPYWHIVSDEQDMPHVTGLGRRFRNIRQFKADLKFFLEHYSPVTEQDIIGHLHEGRALPKRAVLLTFDDGFRENREVIAPILEALGAPAVFFVTTASIDNKHLCYTQKKSLLIDKLGRDKSTATLKEANQALSLEGVPANPHLASRILAVSYRQRGVLDGLAEILQCDFQGYLESRRPYLSSQQIRELLRKGFSVGAHSIDHPLYAELSLQEQLLQTRESLRWLSTQFRIECQSFAFPYHTNGVSLDFFRTIFDEGIVKACFGTAGLIPHPFRYTLPRFTPELSDASAYETLCRVFSRRLMN
jgi:peptidoglycan/xylan/chitin deacetylase (PgdA/CDA1 family)